MSTFTNYLLLTRDYSRTLSNLSKVQQNASAATYYQANIGKVKSVDDLMKNQRLYTYAMKAAGLDDMIYAKAFMKKVLLSDLSDNDSFANKLTDKRYYDFAKSFNFGTDGKVAAVTDVQSDLQESQMTGLYNQSIVDKEASATKTITAYSTGIDAITSVDALLAPANRSLFEFAMTSVGLGDQIKYASLPYYKDILTRGLSDPGNPIFSITNNDTLKEKLRQLVSSFNFATDGTVAAGQAQSITQKSATIAGFLNNSDASSEAASLMYATQSFRQSISTITTASDLVANKSVLDFVTTAYGLDPSKVDPNDVLSALTSDLNDPASAANTLGLAYQRMAQDFNFDTAGNIDAATIQTDDQLQHTVASYLANANAPKLPNPSEFITYGLTINKPGLINNVADFVKLLTGKSPDTANPQVVADAQAQVASNFILHSFGIDLNQPKSADFFTSVFSSDLSDPGSYANTLTDKRWAKMASMFNFDPATGNVVSGQPVQSDASIDEMLERYVGKGFGEAHISEQAKYAFHYDMQYVRTVDDFLADTSSFSFALVAFGFNKDTASKSFFRQILTDPAFAAANDPTDPAKPKFSEFAAAFNFQSDGSVPTGQSAQSKLNEDLMVERFISITTPATGPYALKQSQDYKTAILGIRTVTDLLDTKNAGTLNIAFTAFGIDGSKLSDDDIRKILTSNLNDTTSEAVKRGGGFLEFARAFNFGASGVVPTGTDTQSATQLATTINSYLAKTNPASLDEASGATANFKTAINTLQTLADLNATKAVDEFIKNSNLYNYALTAYGLDPKTEDKANIRKALTADKNASFNFLQTIDGAKYRALADALNFDPDGTVGTPRQAQTISDAQRLATKYAASYPADKRPDYAPNTPTAQENAIKAESDYYAVTILKVSNVDQVTSDTRLKSFILKAFGFAANSQADRDLKKILTSDLSDPKSFANTSNVMAYREIASLFTFDKNGLTKRVPEQNAQSPGGIFETYSDYLQQTLEVEQGQSNPGVRLALYFKRKASTITSSYSLLADKALFEVARTALGISLDAARADIDVLARTIDKKLNVADLKDPAKLDKFIKRFTAMYDVQNSGGVASGNSITLSLLSGTSDTGFSQDTLQSLQNIRYRPF